MQLDERAREREPDAEAGLVGRSSDWSACANSSNTVSSIAGLDADAGVDDAHDDLAAVDARVDRDPAARLGVAAPRC